MLQSENYKFVQGQNCQINSLNVACFQQLPVDPAELQQTKKQISCKKTSLSRQWAFFSSVRETHLSQNKFMK